MSEVRHAPADFDTYWSSIDSDLEQCEIAAEIDPAPSRSTEFATSYDVRLTSSGPYRIFGYLSIPKGEGPFPGLYYTPRYGSVIKAPHYDDRKRYVALALAHRGQRLADKPFFAPYPGLLTHGIESKDTYIYRDVLADCLRGAELLASVPEVDPANIGIVGDDLALITSARRPVFSAAAIAGLMFRAALDRAAFTQSYPIEEFNDYLRLHPESRDRVAEALSYFDPIHHAGFVDAATHFTVDDPGSVNGPEWLEPLSDRMNGRVEHYQLSHEGGADRDSVDAWMANQLGSTPIPGLWAEAL